MKGSRYQSFKNAAISVLMGIVIMRCITYPDTASMFFIGYLVAQITWCVLVTYDEIVRQRRRTSARHRMSHTQG